MSEPATAPTSTRRTLSGKLVLLLWGITFLLAYVGVGPWIGYMAEGIDRAPTSLRFSFCST